MPAFRSLIEVGVLALLSCSMASALAAPFTATIDEFWIVKNANEIFRDSFSDGAPPPTGPDGVTTYGVFGPAGMTGEAGGKLTMTPSLGDHVLITASFADVSTSGVRLLATNPANPNFLGQDSSFEIHGLYDLASLPTVPGQSFGIRATDRAPGIGNEGNNVYYLFIGTSPITGDRVLALRLLDYTAGTSTVIDSFSIESELPGADQVEFIFAKAAGSDALTASYLLYDDSMVIASSSIGSGSTLSIYDGEPYIRAQFETTDRIPVPEPGTVALLGLGVAGIALSRRSRQREA